MNFSSRILLLACLFFATQTLAFVHSTSDEHLHENNYSECQSPLHHVDGELTAPDILALTPPLLKTTVSTTPSEHKPLNTTYHAPIRGSPASLLS